MKRLSLIIIIFSIIATGSIVYAQEPDKTSGWYYCPYCGKYFGTQTEYGMGQGMSGGKGMMDSIGYGTGTETWRGSYDYGREKKMMQQSEACQTFLDETAELRKELHDKRFAYHEAIRDPQIDPEEVAKLERDLQELQGEISAKRPLECMW
jgi:hypothetical protein